MLGILGLILAVFKCLGDLPHLSWIWIVLMVLIGDELSVSLSQSKKNKED